MLLVRFIFVTALLAGCSRKPLEKASAKVLALSPADHVGTSMGLSGQITALGPGGAYFILEDESGKVLVSTHRVSSDLNCKTGNRVSLVGKLERFERENSYFFSMDKLIECSP